MLLVEGNDVRRVAQWKRTYMPGVFWGGVNNTYRGNTVRFSPHNCFTGGGDFGDGVLNTFENNTLADCTFETTDSGAFYTVRANQEQHANHRASGRARAHAPPPRSAHPAPPPHTAAPRAQCGQGGNAFTGRGNVLRNNTFLRVKNTKGLGVQV